jgi:hypothetical protein
MARRHGEEVLAILKTVDDAERASKEKVKEMKRMARRRETEERQAEKKRLEMIEKEEKRREKEREKAEKDRLAVIDKAAKKAQREADRAEKQRLREQAKPKRARRPALVGSSVFNSAGPSTPVAVQVCILHCILCNCSNYAKTSYQPNQIFHTPHQVQPQPPISSYSSMSTPFATTFPAVLPHTALAFHPYTPAAFPTVSASPSHFLPHTALAFHGPYTPAATSPTPSRYRIPNPDSTQSFQDGR